MKCRFANLSFHSCLSLSILFEFCLSSLFLTYTSFDGSCMPVVSWLVPFVVNLCVFLLAMEMFLVVQLPKCYNKLTMLKSKMQWYWYAASNDKGIFTRPQHHAPLKSARFSETRTAKVNIPFCLIRSFLLYIGETISAYESHNKRDHKLRVPLHRYCLVL